MADLVIRNATIVDGTGAEPRPGDVVVTSPASTLVPPNLPVGVVQSVALGADPAPTAVVQLSAPLQAVDWVQVVRP